MSTNALAHAMDTEDETELSVGTYRSVHTGDIGVVITDSTQFPYNRIRLTVAETRRLVEFLTDQIYLADTLNA